MNSDNLNLTVEANFKIIFEGNKIKTEINSDIDLSIKDGDKIQGILLKSFLRQIEMPERLIEIFMKNKEIARAEKYEEVKGGN